MLNESTDTPQADVEPEPRRRLHSASPAGGAQKDFQRMADRMVWMK